MADAIDQRYATKVERPLDPCFVETENYQDGRKVHIVRSSRLIVLVQDDPNATLENTVVAAKGENLTIYGDRVRVAGRIELRGLKVSIHCRELEFAPAGLLNPEIDVTGEDGEDPDPGLNAVADPQASQGTEQDRKGKDGKPGVAGGKPNRNCGDPGGKGGTITIACHTLRQLAPVTLKADGGQGGAGIRGKDGQQGGNGLNGAKPDFFDDPGPITSAAKGGQGGDGGNGEDGGRGGNAGQISLYCLNLLPSNTPMTLSVGGGNGGQGGAAGNGGAGGNGGKPAAGAVKAADRWYARADGADSGGVGAPGVAGFGGGCGNPGAITLRCAAEALRYPAGKFLQEKTATLRLIKKSGALGGRGASAAWGSPGEPGDCADEGNAKVPGPDGVRVIFVQQPGNKGNQPKPDLNRAATRTPPAVQQPVQRAWEVWEGEPAAPPPPPLPAPPTARPMPSPGPKPVLTIPKVLEDNIQRFLKEPQRFRAQLQASQRQVALLQHSFNEERQQWEAANRSYEVEQRKFEEVKRKYEQEKSKYPEVVNQLNLKHAAQVADLRENVLKECWAQWELKEIAARQNEEQLQMLYDYVRTRYLLAPNGRALLVPRLSEQVAWLVSVSYAKLDRIKNKENQEVAGKTPEAIYHLWQAASSTQGNLWTGNNIFGHDGKYAVLGDLDKHVQALQEMRKNLRDIEKFYDQTVRFHNMATSWAANWSQVKDNAKAVVDAMDGKRQAIRQELPKALAAIEEKERARKVLLKTLQDEADHFKVEIEDKKLQLTPQDFFGMLNQLSFTNRELVQPAHKDAQENIVPEKFMLGGGLATGAMLLSQAGELAAKAMENVVTDDGQPVNKKYIIRNVKALSAKLPTLSDFKQNLAGKIELDPNSEVRLLATREQFNSILENFHEQSKNAQDISRTLDAYVDAVQERNAKVDEWNQLLAIYAYCGAESQKAEAQSEAVEKTKSNNPGLVAMARFSTALNRHALEDYLQRLYEAGRVCTLHTLHEFDPFSSLSAARSESGADIGFLNSQMLAKAVNDFIGASLDSAKARSDRTEMQSVEFELTPDKDPLVFALLKKGKPATFTVTAPDARAVLPGAKPPSDPEEPPGAVNPFALKADVRLTHIVPSVFLEMGNPLQTLCSKYTIELTHSGKETFCRPEGDKVLLNHDPVEKPFEYSDEAAKPDDGALSNEHSGMIGPFCSWDIFIPENGVVYKRGVKPEDKNLNKIRSIRIAFKGQYRAFTPAAIQAAKEDARAIPEEVTDKTFAQLVLKSEKPIVVDFRAKEDAASPALKSMRNEVKRKYTGQVRFATLNVEENKKTYESYKKSVAKLPSLVAFIGGDVLQVMNGALPDKEIPGTMRKLMGQPSGGAGAGGAGAD